MLQTPSRANTPPPVPTVHLTSDDQGRQFLNFTSIPGYHYVIEESTDNHSWQPAPAGLIYGNGTSHNYFLTQIPPATLDPDGDGTPNFILRSQKTTHVRMIHVFFLKDGGNQVRIDGMLPSPETGSDPQPYFALIPGDFPPRDANSGMHTMLDYETETERYSVSVLLTGTNALPPSLTPDQPEPPPGSSGDFIRDQLTADPSPLVSLLTSPIPASTTPPAAQIRRFYRVRVYEIDTNGNGLPDWWERQFFPLQNPFALPGAPTYLDPSADFDNDGLTNLDEVLRGTNPNARDTDGDGSVDRQDTEPLDATITPLSQVEVWRHGGYVGGYIPNVSPPNTDAWLQWATSAPPPVVADGFETFENLIGLGFVQHIPAFPQQWIASGHFGATSTGEYSIYYPSEGAVIETGSYHATKIKLVQRPAKPVPTIRTYVLVKRAVTWSNDNTGNRSDYNPAWVPPADLPLDESIPPAVSTFDLTIPANQTESPEYDLSGVFQGPFPVPGGRKFVWSVLPIEFEVKHTEIDPATGQVVKPGANTMLRDEIVDIKIKVPPIGTTDWMVDLTVEPQAMRNENLPNRGNVQMYDFGQVETNGTVTPDKTQFVLQASAEGGRTIKAVFNKEGTLKIKMKSTDGSIDFTSPEHTISKRIRKYGIPYAGYGTHDPNQYDQEFIDAAKHWGDFYGHELDTVERLKAMAVAESDCGANPDRPNDILSVGHDLDNMLETMQGNPVKWEYDRSVKQACDETYKKLNYTTAGIGSTREAIKWGTLWLYHKAMNRKQNPAWTYEKRNKAPMNILDGDEEPYYNFKDWDGWTQATQEYNGRWANYASERVGKALYQGLHWNAGTSNTLWPIRSNKTARP